MRIKNPQKRKYVQRQMRHGRVRAKISGTNEVPRISVFRSAKHISAQLIDDIKGKTIVGATDLEIKEKTENKVKMGEAVGRLLAMKAKEKGIKQARFDRGGYLYHGRIKALADGARDGGLEF